MTIKEAGPVAKPVKGTAEELQRNETSTIVLKRTEVRPATGYPLGKQIYL